MHELRARHDAVLTGIGTVLADDPQLTVRGIEGAKQPLRAVMDTHLRIPREARLLGGDSGGGKVVVFTGVNVTTDLPVEVVNVANHDSYCDPDDVLAKLSGMGVGSVLLECGGTLAASFMMLGLIDRIEWFRAPMVIGGEGRPALGELALTSLREAPAFELQNVERLGRDLHETYVRVPDGD